MAATLDTVIAEIEPFRKQLAAGVMTATSRASTVADHHSAVSQGLDRTEGSGRQDHLKGYLALASSADGRNGPKPGHIEVARSWMKSYKPEELFDDERQAEAGTGRVGPDRRRVGWGRIPMRTAACFSRSEAARLPEVCGGGAEPGTVIAEATRVSRGVSP